MDEQEATSELIIFLEGQEEERYTIRRVFQDGRLYFSVVDIITALKVSQRAPRQYWAQLKERVKDEGFVEATSRIKQFPLKAEDERFRKTDCADQETLLRLIQSIPSPRVERIKQWLARVGSEKLDEMALQYRPEAAFEQMVQSYIERGYEPDWAWTRAQGDLVRNEGGFCITPRNGALVSGGYAKTPYLAPEHLPTAAGCTAARFPLGQLANTCAARRVPPRGDGLRPPREQIGS